ncbi:hypothetical protein AU384_04715 [Bacillus halotolerans]|nr:hypothetical protein AU384_04715 [Bacillus halotolerans]
MKRFLHAQAVRNNKIKTPAAMIKIGMANLHFHVVFDNISGCLLESVFIFGETGPSWCNNIYDFIGCQTTT